MTRAERNAFRRSYRGVAMIDGEAVGGIFHNGSGLIVRAFAKDGGYGETLFGGRVLPATAFTLARTVDLGYSTDRYFEVVP